LPAEALRRIVLVGFMGAGKTAVGEALARRLGWRHLDLDRWIEAERGARVSEIFAARGEAEFRRLEGEATRAAAVLDRVVVSTGGGWVLDPGHWEALREGALFVWLRVGVATALERTAAEEGSRPLLSGPDPAARARALLGRREPLYAAADWALDTDDRSPAQLAEDILQRVTDRILPA
jgi:shikimate kinase